MPEQADQSSRIQRWPARGSGDLVPAGPSALAHPAARRRSAHRSSLPTSEAAKANIVVEMRSCRDPEPPPGELEAPLGSVHKDAEPLANAMLDKITVLRKPQPEVG